MLPTYCMIKLFKKATNERLKRNLRYGDSTTSKHTRSSLINVIKTETPESKCRVCLEEGTISIFNEVGSFDISNAIQTFTGIIIETGDSYPKHICESCHRLLLGAILLRETATKSDRILKQIHQEMQNESHKKIVKKEKGDKSECPILKKYFLPITSDANKSKVKRQKQKVQCQVCYKIVTKSYYREHYSLHEVSPVKYVCDACGKSFRVRTAYKNHLYTHSKEFPFKCQLCPYRGRYSGLLKMHMRTHNGDYKYKCSECPAKFLLKCNLNKHSLKHKDPIYQCGDCKKMFHSRLLKDRHFEVKHLGIKNHVCNICGKTFGYKKTMSRHQLDAHKRKKKLSGRTPSYLEVENQSQ